MKTGKTNQTYRQALLSLLLWVRSHLAPFWRISSPPTSSRASSSKQKQQQRGLKWPNRLRWGRRWLRAPRPRKGPLWPQPPRPSRNRPLSITKPRKSVFTKTPMDIRRLRLIGKKSDQGAISMLLIGTLQTWRDVPLESGFEVKSGHARIGNCGKFPNLCCGVRRPVRAGMRGGAGWLTVSSERVDRDEADCMGCQPVREKPASIRFSRIASRLRLRL